MVKILQCLQKETIAIKILLFFEQFCSQSCQGLVYYGFSWTLKKGKMFIALKESATMSSLL